MPAAIEPGPLQGLVERLAADVEAGQLPGAVLRVRHQGREYGGHVGWLDAQRRVPMRADAIFRIFSMTKPLTSVLALRLVEQGRLDLEDRLVRHWPEAPWRPEAEAITLRDLLRHTAGYTYGARCAEPAVREAYAREGLPLNPRGLTTADFMQGIARVPLLHPPGECWEYGNATDVLGALLEAVTGQRLRDALAGHILQTLQMASTGFECRSADLGRLAQPLPRDPDTGVAWDDPNQTYDAAVPARMDSGGAGALSTADDYLRFASALLDVALGRARADRGMVGAPILQRETLALMTRDHLAPDRVSTLVEPGIAALNSTGFGFGLGFAVRLAGVPSDLPGAPGFFFWSGTAGTLFWADPAHDLAAVFMSQAPGASRQRYRRLAIAGVYAALGLSGPAGQVATAEGDG